MQLSKEEVVKLGTLAIHNPWLVDILDKWHQTELYSLPIKKIDVVEKAQGRCVAIAELLKTVHDSVNYVKDNR